MTGKLEDLKLQYKLRKATRIAMAVFAGTDCIMAGLALSREDYGFSLFTAAVMTACLVSSHLNGLVENELKEEIARLQEVKDTYKR